MSVRQNIQGAEFFGVGSYTVGEAARLIGTSALNISRWMKGYTSAAKKLSIESRRYGHRSGRSSTIISRSDSVT
ncbi:MULTISPECIES: hypothetical protein [unclassified Mesorhizobium]|uniref:hypothetical protein n=1 Tax=unclassified Mesorhizobium TaxID=325217 RepID=UPI001FD87910|nr:MULTISPECIES: hypothetical protein [unclassified Mesorhizobium]